MATATSPFQIGGIKQQFFSANSGDVNNRAFIDAIAELMKSKDPVIRKNYYNSIGIKCNVLGLFENFIGYDTYCAKKDDTWTVGRYFPQSKVLPYSSATVTTIANNATSVLSLPVDRQFAALGNIFPQVGEYILIGANSYMKVTAVSTVVGTPTITVQNLTGASVTISASGNFISITGINKLDCTCPSLKGRLPNQPLLEDYKFWSHYNKITLCNKDLETCNRFEYQYELYNPKTDQYDTITNLGSQMIKTFMADYEKDKEWKIMYNNESGQKGLEPQLKTKAILWNLSTPTEFTDADLDVLHDTILEKGLAVKEWVVMAEVGLFRAAQKYMRDMAAGRFVFGCFDADEMCKMLNIDFCAFERNGLKFKFVLNECSSTGQGVGALGS